MVNGMTSPQSRIYERFSGLFHKIPVPTVQAIDSYFAVLRVVIFITMLTENSGVTLHNNVKNGATRMNGTSLSGHTNYPNNLSIITLKTLGNVSADRFGQDRGFNGRQWIGKLGELLIYNSALSDSEISKVEGYLAHKWGLTGSLPSSHDYKVSLPGHLENVSQGQTSMGLSGLSSATAYNTFACRQPIPLDQACRTQFHLLPVPYLTPLPFPFPTQR